MRKITFLFVALLISTMGIAQNAPIDFEAGGFGASWTWNVFENDSNLALQFVANPNTSGINTSSTAAKFTAVTAGQPWAGTETAHGATNLGSFVLDTSNSLIKIMVYKPVISDVGIKLTDPSGWSMGEIKVANTVINQWEELTFDFSSHTNPPAGSFYDQIVVFPDFDLAGRTQNNTCYFDNITFNSAPPAASGPAVAAPVPPALTNVISVFSGAFADLAGTDFNPPWGQSTIVTFEDIQGDTTLKYANLNYQGTQFASAIDASGMDMLHVDMWTADATTVNISLISSGPVETPYSLAVTPNTWVSYDIPISAWSSVVDMTDVIQFKFDGGTGSETIYLDNIYFYVAPVVTGPTVAAPTPTWDPTKVISVYSNAYTDVSGTDFNPAWGQSTIVTMEVIAGDDVLKYANLNYQGTTFGSAIDASTMTHLHVDMWTADATTVNVSCISSGPVETPSALAITPSQWVSYDIPLTEFSSVVDMSDLIQFKFDGGSGTETIYLDNLYFYRDDTSIGDDLTDDKSTLKIYPNPVNAGETVVLDAEVKRYFVFDISGKNILNGTSQEISTENLLKGMYIIRVETNDGSIQTQKLIVN